MVQLDVVLLPTGGTQVYPDPISAHTNDSVSWVFHSFNSAVKSVEVVFQNQSQSYFFHHKGGGQTKNVIADLVAGNATIWGRAPNANGPGTQARVKYTINAYDVNGNAMNQYYLDPDVITEQP